MESRARGGIAIRLPFDPNELWGDRAAHHVAGTVAGHGVRGALTEARDGSYYLELGPSWCRDAHFEDGASVEVDLGPEGPQYATLAEDVRAALGAEPQVLRFFESLATFYRQGFVGWIEQAKRPETRARRIAETVEALKAGKKQR